MYPYTLKYRAIIHYKFYLRSIRKIASIYGVSKSTIARWVKQNDVNRTLKPRNRSKKFSKLLTCIESFMANQSLVTLNEISEYVFSKTKIKRSVSTIHRCLKLLKISRKKVTKQSVVPFSDKDYDYQTLLKAYDHSDTVCVDETGFYISECPRYGYSKKGSRIVVTHNPRKDKRRVNVVMAINRNGLVDFEIRDEPYNREYFASFISRLKASNCPIIMDNIQFHKSDCVREQYKKKGSISGTYTPV